MPSAQIITGREPGSVNTVVRHLWAPLLESGRSRVVVGRHSEPGWQIVRSFSLQPLHRSPKLLVSSGRGRTLGQALICYRRLRTTRGQIGRLLTAGKVTTGLNRSDNRVAVETTDRSEATELEPITIMERVLDQQLWAVVGIRDSANGKATLQLFNRAGRPASYAKLAWNEHTATYVRTETAALHGVSFARRNTSAPRLLAEGMVGDQFPYLMTEPLPPTVRQVSGRGELSALEVTRLFHSVRRSPVRDTGQFQAVLARLDRVCRNGSDAKLAELAGHLAHQLGRSVIDLPVMARWHGDLVPWNAALDAKGTLWLWDWESSEADAIAGLDVLHWLVNSDRPAAGADLVLRLREVFTEATDALRALGMDAEQSAIAMAGYALTFAERNWSLALANGNWARHRVDREATVALLKYGISQFAH